MKNTLVSCFLVTVLVYGASSLPQVTKCAANDLKCIKKSAQAMIPIFAEGIPELQMDRLDPLVVEKMVDAGSPNLNLKVKNLVITGLKGCQVKKIERDLTKSKMYVKLLCSVRAEGQYEMRGHILVLPIEGKGDAKVVLNKMLMDVEADMSDRTGRDGKKYWHIKGSRFSYDLMDKSIVNFENLFDGNEVLAQAAHQVITENSNDIVREIGKPIIKSIVDKIIGNCNKFYKAMPAEEISLD